MSEEEQIRRLKDEGRVTTDPIVRKRAIDALAAFGNNGILPIEDIISITIDNDVKAYALETIRKIKESSR